MCCELVTCGADIARPRVLLFFFSSRRRHTRLQGDWSVCSSDLTATGAILRSADSCAAVRVFAAELAGGAAGDCNGIAHTNAGEYGTHECLDHRTAREPASRGF